MHQSSTLPKANLHQVLEQIGNHMNIDVIKKVNFRDLDGVVEERNPTITVDHPGFTQAKDVFGRSIGSRQRKGTKQSITSLLSFLKTDSRDLLGGGVNLMIVVTIDL